MTPTNFAENRYWLGIHNFAENSKYKTIMGDEPMFTNWKNLNEPKFDVNRGAAFDHDESSRRTSLKTWTSIDANEELNILCIYLIP